MLVSSDTDSAAASWGQSVLSRSPVGAMAVLAPVVDMAAVAFMTVMAVTAISALSGRAAEEEPNQTALVRGPG